MSWQSLEHGQPASKVLSSDLTACLDTPGSLSRRSGYMCKDSGKAHQDEQY
jgi:hypothetical protein